MTTEIIPTTTIPAVRSRSAFAFVMRETFGKVGAKLGGIWIGIVAFCAVFAPFLANSLPFACKRDGRWEFPLFRALSTGDLVAIIVFATIVLFIIARRYFNVGVQLAVLIIALICLSLVYFHEPPTLIVYSQYREDQSAGLIDHVIRAPLPYSPRDRLRDSDEKMDNNAPSNSHWMGTTPNSEDVLSRMIHACRIAILIGFISTGIAITIGCIIGGFMGYFSGIVDLIGMRIIEIFEAIPTLFLLITFVAFYGRDLYIMMAIIGLTTWTGDARFIRAEFLRLRNQDFVQAAKALGLPLHSILFRHMLPNGITPVLVSASFGVASAILFEAMLSFLGLGLIDEASWGMMLNQARGVGTEFHWWLAIFPGGAIFLTVFAYNMIGEAFRDALDPKLRKRD